MSTFSESYFPPPQSSSAFEGIVLDVFRERLRLPNLKIYGRSGQAQKGVDIIGDTSNGYVGIQCKNHPGKNISTLEIDQEVAKAEHFPQALCHYIIATSASRDTGATDHIRSLSNARKQTGKFSVEIFFWEDPCYELGHNPALVTTHFPQLVTMTSNSSTMPASIIELSEAALNHHNPAERKHAIDTLVQAATPAAKDALIRALTHDIRDVRIHAAFAVAESEDPRTVPGLIEALESNLIPQFCQRAAITLRSMGPKAAPYLIKALQHKQVFVRRNAAWALGCIKNVDATSALLSTLSDEDEYVKGAAAWALSSIANQDVVPTLVEMISSQNPELCAAAADVLGRMKEESAVSKLIDLLEDDRQVSHVMMNAVDGGISWHKVCHAAEVALRTIGTTEALSAVIDHNSRPPLTSIIFIKTRFFPDDDKLEIKCSCFACQEIFLPGDRFFGGIKDNRTGKRIGDLCPNCVETLKRNKDKLRLFIKANADRAATPRYARRMREAAEAKWTVNKALYLR
jgi:HEAT repeat protein